MNSSLSVNHGSGAGIGPTTPGRSVDFALLFAPVIVCATAVFHLSRSIHTAALS